MSKAKLCNESEISDGQIRVFHTKGGPVALVKQDGALHAFQETCTHADVSLAEGSLPEQGVIECPAHGGQFRIDNGEAIKAPANSPLDTYPVSIENGEIFIEI